MKSSLDVQIFSLFNNRNSSNTTGLCELVSVHVSSRKDTTVNPANYTCGIISVHSSSRTEAWFNHSDQICGVVSIKVPICSASGIRCPYERRSPLKEYKVEYRSTFSIVPKSLLRHWRKETSKWLDPVRQAVLQIMDGFNMETPRAVGSQTGNASSSDLYKPLLCNYH